MLEAVIVSKEEESLWQWRASKTFLSPPTPTVKPHSLYLLLPLGITIGKLSKAMQIHQTISRKQYNTLLLFENEY